MRYIATDNKFIVEKNLNLMNEIDLAPDAAFRNHIDTVSVDSGYVRQTVQQQLKKLVCVRSLNAYRMYAIANMLKDEILPTLTITQPESHPAIALLTKSAGLGPDINIQTAKKAIESRMDGKGQAVGGKDSPKWDVRDFLKMNIRENFFDDSKPSSWLFCCVALGTGSLPSGHRLSRNHRLGKGGEGER